MGNTTLLNMLYPSGTRPTVVDEHDEISELGTLMGNLRLNLNQRLEVLKILNLQAIEGHLAILARRAEFILEQMAASQITRD